MQPQAEQRERTIAAVDGRLQAWLLEQLRQYGPGRYLLQVAPDGRVTLKYLTPAVRAICPERLRIPKAQGRPARLEDNKNAES